MDYSVLFNNLVTNLSISSQIKLKQVRFVHSKRGGVKNPKNQQTYPEVRGIEVYCHLDKEPEEGRKILQELETALYFAEEVFTGLVAKTQCYCYLARPITCTYRAKNYVLNGSIWREYTPVDNIFRGGSRFLDNASFLDEHKNFHPMFHFYRVAKDETHSNDYRALNAWRFLEALHGKQGSRLKKHLISLGQPEELVDNFYENIRCAVAHANRLKNNPLDKSVLLPKSYETQFNGNLVVELSGILKYLDGVVEKLDPGLSNIAR